MLEVKLNLASGGRVDLDTMGLLFSLALPHSLARPDLLAAIDKFLKTVGIDGDSTVLLTLPDHAIAAVLLSVLIYRRTGRFPVLQPMVKTPGRKRAPGSMLKLNDLLDEVSRIARNEGLRRPEAIRWPKEAD